MWKLFVIITLIELVNCGGPSISEWSDHSLPSSASSSYDSEQTLSPTPSSEDFDIPREPEDPDDTLVGDIIDEFEDFFREPSKFDQSTTTTVDSPGSKTIDELPSEKVLSIPSVLTSNIEDSYESTQPLNPGQSSESLNISSKPEDPDDTLVGDMIDEPDDFSREPSKFNQSITTTVDSPASKTIDELSSEKVQSTPLILTSSNAGSYESTQTLSPTPDSEDFDIPRKPEDPDDAFVGDMIDDFEDFLREPSTSDQPTTTTIDSPESKTIDELSSEKSQSNPIVLTSSSSEGSYESTEPLSASQSSECLIISSGPEGPDDSLVGDMIDEHDDLSREPPKADKSTTAIIDSLESKTIDELSSKVVQSTPLILTSSNEGSYERAQTLSLTPVPDSEDFDIPSGLEDPDDTLVGDMIDEFEDFLREPSTSDQPTTTTIDSPERKLIDELSSEKSRSTPSVLTSSSEGSYERTSPLSPGQSSESLNIPSGPEDLDDSLVGDMIDEFDDFSREPSRSDQPTTTTSINENESSVAPSKEISTPSTNDYDENELVPINARADVDDFEEPKATSTSAPNSTSSEYLVKQTPSKNDWESTSSSMSQRVAKRLGRPNLQFSSNPSQEEQQKTSTENMLVIQTLSSVADTNQSASPSRKIIRRIVKKKKESNTLETSPSPLAENSFSSFSGGIQVTQSISHGSSTTAFSTSVSSTPSSNDDELGQINARANNEEAPSSNLKQQDTEKSNLESLSSPSRNTEEPLSNSSLENEGSSAISSFSNNGSNPSASPSRKVMRRVVKKKKESKVLDTTSSEPQTENSLNSTSISHGISTTDNPKHSTDASLSSASSTSSSDFSSTSNLLEVESGEINARADNEDAQSLKTETSSYFSVIDVSNKTSPSPNIMQHQETKNSDLESSNYESNPSVSPSRKIMRRIKKKGTKISEPSKSEEFGSSTYEETSIVPLIETSSTEGKTESSTEPPLVVSLRNYLSHGDDKSGPVNARADKNDMEDPKSVSTSPPTSEKPPNFESNTSPSQSKDDNETEISSGQSKTLDMNSSASPSRKINRRIVKKESSDFESTSSQQSESSSSSNIEENLTSTSSMSFVPSTSRKIERRIVKKGSKNLESSA